MTYAQLLGQIQKGQFAPVYYLFGEEGYYLDQLEAALETHVLAGAEPSFNLEIFYGPEASGPALVGSARSFPVMAQRRLVLVREAHRLRKDAQEALAGYLDSAVASTVLAFVHREKKGLDARTAFARKLKAVGTVYEAKALYENQVPTAVEELLATRGIQIEPRALQLLVASLGTRLQRIAIELNKLSLQLPAEGPRRITEALVHELVGIDREFNVFELTLQLGLRQRAKAHQTVHYLLQQPKANPSVLVIGQLASYYTKLALLKQEGISGEKAIADTLGINPYFAKDYARALPLHTLPQLAAALQYIAQADRALKGITPTRMDEAHVLKTLVTQLVNH